MLREMEIGSHSKFKSNSGCPLAEENPGCVGELWLGEPIPSQAENKILLLSGRRDNSADQEKYQQKGIYKANEYSQQIGFT